MTEQGAWLRDARTARDGSDAGLVTENGRVPWRELLTRALDRARTLPGSEHGWVIPGGRLEESVAGLLTVGLAEPSPRWIVGDPASWSTGETAGGGTLWKAGAWAAPPADVTGPVYATATSGTASVPRLLFGRPHALPDLVSLYTADMPEYAQAEVFATCSSLDFGAALYLVVIPAVVLGRDLVLFRPGQWRVAAEALAGRPGVCLAAPAAAMLGARSVRPGRYDSTSFVPSGGGLTPERAERIQAGFPGCRFLTMFGSTETGLLTVGREVREDGHIGWPLPGKPVWLEDTRADGTGMIWTRGPDTRFAATGGELRVRDGAVSSGDLVHGDPASGFVLDGRADALLKVDGASVYPETVVRALRAIPGVRDASLSVDRSGVTDRVRLVVVGEATEARVRQVCAELPTPLTPHTVVFRPVEDDAYDDRGKVRA